MDQKAAKHRRRQARQCQARRRAPRPLLMEGCRQELEAQLHRRLQHLALRLR